MGIFKDNIDILTVNGRNKTTTGDSIFTKGNFNILDESDPKVQAFLGIEPKQSQLAPQPAVKEKEDSSFLGETTKGILETTKGVLGIGNNALGRQKAVIGAGRDIAENVLQTPMALVDLVTGKKGQRPPILPDIETDTITDEIIRTTIGFFGLFLPGMAATKIPKISKFLTINSRKFPALAERLSNLVKTETAAGIAGGFGIDPNDPNLSNWLKSKSPKFAKPIFKFLSTDPDDNRAVNQLRNVLEGLGFGFAIEGMIVAFKAWRGTLHGNFKKLIPNKTLQDPIERGTGKPTKDIFITGKDPVKLSADFERANAQVTEEIDKAIASVVKNKDKAQVSKAVDELMEIRRETEIDKLIDEQELDRATTFTGREESIPAVRGREITEPTPTVLPSKKPTQIVQSGAETAPKARQRTKPPKPKKPLADEPKKPTQESRIDKLINDVEAVIKKSEADVKAVKAGKTIETAVKKSTGTVTDATARLQKESGKATKKPKTKLQKKITKEKAKKKLEKKAQPTSEADKLHNKLDDVNDRIAQNKFDLKNADPTTGERVKFFDQGKRLADERSDILSEFRDAGIPVRKESLAKSATKAKGRVGKKAREKALETKKTEPKKKEIVQSKGTKTAKVTAKKEKPVKKAELKPLSKLATKKAELERDKALSIEEKIRANEEKLRKNKEELQSIGKESGIKTEKPRPSRSKKTVKVKKQGDKGKADVPAGEFNLFQEGTSTGSKVTTRKPLLEKNISELQNTETKKVVVRQLLDIEKDSPELARSIYESISDAGKSVYTAKVVNFAKKRLGEGGFIRIRSGGIDTAGNTEKFSRLLKLANRIVPSTKGGVTNVKQLAEVWRKSPKLGLELSRFIVETGFPEFTKKLIKFAQKRIQLFKKGLSKLKREVQPDFIQKVQDEVRNAGIINTRDLRELFRKNPEQGMIIAGKIVDGGNLSFPIDLVKFAKKRLGERGSLRFFNNLKENEINAAVASQKFKVNRIGADPFQQRALTNMLKSFGYEVRGVETFEDWERAARLLGFSVGKLLKHTSNKNNFITPQQVIALRNQINKDMKAIVGKQAELNKMISKGANPDDINIANSEIDTLLKNIEVAIGNRIKGGTAAGRTVAAFRAVGDKTLDPTFWLQRAIRLSDEGWTVDEYREILIAIEDLARKGNSDAIAQYVASLHSPGRLRLATLLWKLGLLTSPTTHVANITGTAGMSLLETLSKFPAAGLDVLIALGNKAVGRPMLRTVAVPFSTIKTKITAMPKAKRVAGRFFKTGIYSDELSSKYDLPKNIVFKNKYLKGYQDAVQKSLGAEDIFFREIAMMESLHQQAIVIAKNKVALKQIDKSQFNNEVAALLKDPDPDMIPVAIDAAEFQTFQNKNIISEMISGAKSVGERKNLKKDANKMFTNMALAGVDVVAPFVRTPSNVALRIIDFSPIGFFKAIAKTVMSTRNLLKQKRLIKKGGVLSPNMRIESGLNIQQEFVQDIGRMMTGTGVISTGAILASMGLLTGNAPEDPKERQAFFDEGKQPNSILLGGYWLKLNRIAPLGNLLTLGAIFYNKLQENESTATALLKTVGGGVKAVGDQAFLKGITGVVAGLNDIEGVGGKRYASQMAGSLIPNIIGKVTKVIDPISRRPEGIVESILSRTPFLSKKIAIRRDSLGNIVKIPSGDGTNFFNRMRAVLTTPTPSKKVINNPVLQEARRLDSFIGMPSQTVSGVKMTNAEFDKYQRLQGAKTEVVLEHILASPAYHRLDKSKQIDVWERAIRNVRSFGTTHLFPELMRKRYNLHKLTDPRKLKIVLQEFSSRKKWDGASKKTQERWVKDALNQ